MPKGIIVYGGQLEVNGQKEAPVRDGISFSSSENARADSAKHYFVQ